MEARKEHINVIYPEEGKRYRLNVRTAVGRLTIGKVKQCLAAASSCPIPFNDMVLHLNGVPLSNDRDLCESLGIGNGATLTVEPRFTPTRPQEERQPQQQRISPGNREGAHLNRNGIKKPSRSNNGIDDNESPCAPSSSPPSPSRPPDALSGQRRLLELQTLEQQDAMLHKDVAVRDSVLKHTLRHVDDELDQAKLRRLQLERQRESTEDELRRMHEQEVAAAQERERLAALRAQEAARAAERTAQLAERRQQLRAEQEATRAVALLKLENEKKKATLAQQRALLDAERERALLEQGSFEAAIKARELELRSREIDVEHQRLARICEARALDEDRRLAVKQRLNYYERLGVEPPRALQREAAVLLMDDDEDQDDREDEDQSNGKSSNSLVRSRGPSTTPAHRNGQRHTRQSLSSTKPVNYADAPRTADMEGTLMVPDGSFYDARENAEENLRRLGNDLGLSDDLQFDDSDTCVISIDGDYTLVVTYDAATERLYLYSTLLASLPSCVQHTLEGRLKLFEFLLEASLLGREMCGGGVGTSLRNNFVLISASLYMPTSQPWSLRTLTPQFLHCLQHWRLKLADFLEALEREGVGATSLPNGGGSGGVAGSPAAVPPPPPASPSQPAVSPSWSTSPQQPHQPSNGRLCSVSPNRSHAGSLSPAQLPPPNVGNGLKATPVLGLEVTGTVLVNGMPTHYENGVLVVNAAGPSALAGIQPNDFVEELNGTPIRNVNDFRRVITEQLTPGMLVPVRINRGGVAMIVTVRVEAAWSP